ncbi:MAG: AmmeMemoRadiSam system protein A [Pseudomonadota bacterium]
MSKELTQQEQQVLLQLARDTIIQWVTKQTRPPLPEAKGVLGELRGAFVTIHKSGQLRGCIGNMIGRAPLVETIQEMAIAASTGDPRFPPVSTVELNQIDIEISVLSPLQEIRDVNQIEVGRHGILMSRGVHSGVLLPQVATEYGWDLITFLRHTCLKASLPENAWQDPKTKIEIFSAQVFGE